MADRRKILPAPRIILSVSANVRDLRSYLRGGIMPMGLVRALDAAIQAADPDQVEALYADWRAMESERNPKGWE